MLTNTTTLDDIGHIQEVNESVGIGKLNETEEQTDWNGDNDFNEEESVTSKSVHETNDTDSKTVDSVPVTIDSTKSTEDNESSAVKSSSSSQPKSSEPPDSVDDSMSGG